MRVGIDTELRKVDRSKWDQVHGALARVQLSLPTAEEKGVIGTPAELSTLPRTTMDKREALSIRRQKIKTAAVNSEIKIAKSADPGSKAFFESVQRLRTKLVDVMGRNRKQAVKQPGAKVMSEWFGSYFDLDSAEIILQFNTPPKAPQWKLGKLLRVVEVRRACQKLKSGKSPGPGGLLLSSHCRANRLVEPPLIRQRAG